MIQVRNIKTGKEGRLAKVDGSRIYVAYGRLKVWGKLDNFEFVKTETVFVCDICGKGGQNMYRMPKNRYFNLLCKECYQAVKTEEGAAGLIENLGVKANHALHDFTEDKYGKNKYRGAYESAEVMAEKETTVSTGITCPFCKELIRETSDKHRSVCACNLHAFEPRIVRTFADNVQSEFIADIKNPEIPFIQIGERYRHICESVFGDMPDWGKINREIKARLGEYHLKIIHEYIASDDMPHLDPDEIAIRLAYTERAEPEKKEPVKLRTFPKIELDAVYTLSCTGVTWKKREEKNLWRYRRGEIRMPGDYLPAQEPRLKHGLSDAISA